MPQFPILFANSGVQYVSFPLAPGVRFSASQIGSGWQHCRCRTGDDMVEHGYIQWQVVPNRNRLFFAVDTTLGTDEDDAGYFCKASAMVRDFRQKIVGLLDAKGELFPSLPEIEFVVRTATAEGGEPKERPSCRRFW